MDNDVVDPFKVATPDASGIVDPFKAVASPGIAKSFGFGDIGSAQTLEPLASTQAIKAAPDEAMSLAQNYTPAGLVPALAGGVMMGGANLTNKLGLTNVDPLDVSADVQNRLTYEPRTRAGQTFNDVASAPWQALSKGADLAGDVAEKPDVVNAFNMLTGGRATPDDLGTATRILGQAAPLLAGAKFGADHVDPLTPDASLYKATADASPTAPDPVTTAAKTAQTTLATDVKDTAQAITQSDQNGQQGATPAAPLQPPGGGNGTGVGGVPVSPEEAARVEALKAKPDASAPLPPQTPVDATTSVPLAGGVAEEPHGPNILLDKRIPKEVTIPDKDGNPVTIDVHDAIGLHERTEHPLMKENGMDYGPAHDIATKAENAYVEHKYNVDPDKYQQAIKDHVAGVKDAAVAEGDIHPNIDEQPYTDEGDEHLLNGPPPGTVRLYHGGEDIQPGDRRFLTSDRKYAEGYASKDGRTAAKTFYADVPEDHPEVIKAGKAFDDTGTSVRAPINHFEASPELTSQLRELKDKTTEIPQRRENDAPVLNPARMAELDQKNEAGTATPDEVKELATQQKSALTTAEVGGEHVPGLLNQVGRKQLESSGRMKPVRIKTDADDFSAINNNFGHAVGDAVLKAKAEAMRDVFGPGNAWREGGDEFGAHVDSEAEGAQKMAQVQARVKDTLLQYKDAEGNPVGEPRPVGVSYGQGRGKTPELAAKSADDALYRNKQERKDAGLRQGAKDGRNAGAVEPANEVAGRNDGGSSEAPKTERAPETDNAGPERPVEHSIANEPTNASRVGRGVEELVSKEGTSRKEVFQKAVDAAKNDPLRGQRKAQDIVDGKTHGVTQDDVADLLADRVRISNEYQAAMDNFDNAKNDIDRAGAQLHLDLLGDQLDLNEQASRIAGTEASWALSSRQMVAKNDYSLANQMRQAKIAAGKRGLSDEVVQQLKDHTKRIADLEDQLSKRATKDSSKGTPKKTPDERKQADVQKKIDKMKDQIAARLKACPV